MRKVKTLREMGGLGESLHNLSKKEDRGGIRPKVEKSSVQKG